MTKTIKVRVGTTNDGEGKWSCAAVGMPCDIMSFLHSLPVGHYTLTAEPDAGAALEAWLAVPENARKAAAKAPEYSAHAPEFSTGAFVEAALVLSGGAIGFLTAREALHIIESIPGVVQCGAGVFRLRTQLPDGFLWSGRHIATPQRIIYSVVDGKVTSSGGIPRWAFEAFIAEGLL